MDKLLVITSLVLSWVAFAHDDHDWRMDYEAFINVSVKETTLTKGLTLFAAPKRIDMEYFKKHLITFASVERGSDKNLDLSRNFLAEEYKKLGFEVSLHPFGPGTNFIAEKKGTSPDAKILVLSSHIDSVGNKGANDNGTGTIGVLAVAKELAKQNYTHSIRVLGFDREEKGLKGSDAYVATLMNKKIIIGNINFEMMGVNSQRDGRFHVIDCKSSIPDAASMRSKFLTTHIKDSIATLGLDLTIVKTCTDRSDHASFWRHNIPAIVISENFFGADADPCYHESCDVVDERLNYDYMERIMEAVLDTTEKNLR